MGKYKYNDKEKEINKVLKLNQMLSNEIETEMRPSREAADSAIRSGESLLKLLGYGAEVEAMNKSIKQDDKHLPYRKPVLREWDEIVEEANHAINDDVELEDILSAQEFRIAYDDLERINSEFERKVKLRKMDFQFLLIATALQTVRWILTPELGDKINKDERMSHDDKQIKAEVKRQNKEFKRKHLKSENQGGTWEVNRSERKTWMDMVFNSVPYDATKGSRDLGINLEGGYHRYKTLGHDPILGWIFGTANIMTDTITLNSFVSYRVRNMTITDEMISLPTLFAEVKDVIDYDMHCLPAALFAQGVHLKSDMYTKLGLPIPILGAFSENLSGKLYRGQYDALCLARDAKIVGTSATLAIIINMIIGLVHGMFYNKEKDGEREFFEARTRKILMYSNVIASTCNVITVCIINNPKKLDIGGLLVTISRLFTDVRFIAKLKQEFVQASLDAGMQRELAEIEALFSELSD
ncbi:hypothetical protein PSTEL_04260 [Paenibacillus stellifer]|uniref:Uncharacterized protein n=1 Tax=Paenibacillus stellifer TaxID=169760 RepID=A0A089LNL3_9BACL|nr:hypothetical protein [Paenibacillus stellifer]AIQ62437.1 hypothetical protein PSTEL_04260 [Paenibacillus stellifer]